MGTSEHSKRGEMLDEPFNTYMAFASRGRYPEVQAGSTALVVGCGEGYDGLALAELGYDEVIGIDTNPAKIDTARRNADRFGMTACIFEVGDIAHIAKIFRRGSMDAVLAHNVFEGLSKSEADEGLAAMVELTNPGGINVVRGRLEAAGDIDERPLPRTFGRHELRDFYRQQGWTDIYAKNRTFPRGIMKSGPDGTEIEMKDRTMLIARKPGGEKIRRGFFRRLFDF